MFNMAPAMPRWFAVSVLATHTSALRFSIDASNVARRRVLSRAKPEVAALANLGAEAGRKHFIRNIIEEDLASGKHKTIITRFSPEPNGELVFVNAIQTNLPVCTVSSPLFFRLTSS